MKRLILVMTTLVLLLPASALARRRPTSPKPVPPVVVTPPLVISPLPIPTVTKGFGMNINDIRLDADFTTKLNDIKSLGITWVRTDFEQGIVEKKQNVYDWSSYDKTIDQINAAGMNMMFLLTSTADWNYAAGCSNDMMCHPNVGPYADFVREAVAHYSTKGVHNWEVWNEPNLGGFWKPKSDAAQYTELLKYVYSAVKNIDQTATVISAGLAPANTEGDQVNQLDFAKNMYKFGAKNYFDAFGYHPYGFPAPPSDYQEWSGWTRMSQTPTSIRSIMTANGDANKQIFMTEYGAATNGPGTAGTCTNYYPRRVDHVDNCLQSKIMTDAVAIVKSTSWAGPLFFYDYKDLGTKRDSPEWFFGLYLYNGTPKPAYSALKQAILQ